MSQPCTEPVCPVLAFCTQRQLDCTSWVCCRICQAQHAISQAAQEVSVHAAMGLWNPKAICTVQLLLCSDLGHTLQEPRP